MTDTELIRKIQELRQVKPSQDWVVLTKNRILGINEQAEARTGFVFWAPRLAWAPVISVFIIIGIFGFAQSTVPGNLFFPFKKMTESVEVGLSIGVEKPKTQLRLANKRLDELGKIAEANNVRNLGPAIKEFQANISQAIEDLAAISVIGSDEEALKELVAETHKMAENKERIETVLGATIGDTEELETALVKIEKETAAYLIADLEKRTLSSEDQVLLDEAKGYFSAGEYNKSLETIWQLSNK